MITLIGIELLLSLPDHVFRYMIQSYLGFREILYLDTAVTNHLYRDEILLKIKDVLIERADFQYIHSYINWMNLRNINVDLLYISLSHILFLLYGMQYNIENIMHILKRCISNSRNIVMDFSHCTITNESLIDTISTILNVNHNKNNTIVHGVKKSTDLFYQRVPGMIELNISCCSGLTSKGVDQLIQQCKTLQSLNIGWCQLVTNDGLITIARQCNDLMYIDIECCVGIIDDSLIAIGQYCSRLLLLNANCCRQLSDKGFVAIAEGCRSLQIIKLNNCDKITKKTVKSLSDNCRGLTTLEIRDVKSCSDGDLNESLGMTMIGDDGDCCC